jgi:signal peptide peptidase SppA
MSHTSFTDVLDYLRLRNEGGIEVEMAVAGGRHRRMEELCYNPDTRTGVLTIDGPLTYLEYTPMCAAEPTSYQRLETEARTMLQAGAKILVMDVDSGGGEAYAMMETAQTIRSLADQYEAKIYAYVDGISASAAYGLSVIADEVIANPMAEVGSVGVVVSLANYSEAEKKFGIERTFIYAGESKVPYDAEGKFTEDFRADIQEKVDTLYESFTKHVADMRGMTQEAVKATQAKVFSADKALELGMIDKIMTRLEFHDYIGQLTTQDMGRNMPIGSMFKKSTNTQEADAEMNKIEELEAQLAASEEAHKAQLAELTTALTAATSALAVANAALDAVAEKEAQALAAAKEAEATVRKERLVAALGAEKAATVFAAIGELPEAAFEAVVSGYEASALKEEESPLFREVGVDGEGEMATDAGISLVTQMIAARAAKQRK